MDKSFDISRRTFLKGSAALGIAAASAQFSGSSLLVPLSKAAAASSKEIKANFCSGCHQPTCANLVTVTNGVATELMGDPTAETNQGRLCPRGLAALNSLYNPYRVKAPMKRTNPGRTLDTDPKWVEISWEEALSTCAAKVKEARDSDPRSFIFFRGFGFEETRLAFDTASGTSNSLGSSGPLCPEHFTALHLSGVMLDRIDLERCNYVVIIGRSFGPDFAIASSSSKNFADAVDRGMKVVNVDPRSDRAAQNGEWVPIRPGSDTAFGLGLVNTIIHEIGKYDENWLRIRSNAPYLIPDTKQEIKGTRVYTEDYVRDPATKKPLVWDTVKNQAVPFDSSKGETYALIGTYNLNGQSVKPSFQVLKDYVAQFTPEWASERCTVPAAKIREIANNLVTEARIGSTIDINGFKFPYRPACVDIGRGSVTNRLGTQAYKALGTVNVLLGNIDVPGGMQGCSNNTWWNFLQPDEDGVLKATSQMANQVMGSPFKFPPDRLDMETFYPMHHSTPGMAWKAIIDPDKYYIKYPLKAMMVHAGNPVISNSNRAQALEALAKIPFLFTISYHFDEITQISDIIMPEDHSLERTNMYRLFRNEKESNDQNRGLMGTFIKRPAVARTLNTMNYNDIAIQLANRAGFLANLNKAANGSLLTAVDKSMVAGLTKDYELDPAKVYTWDEIVERKIKSDFGPNASFADFDKSSFKPFRLKTIAETYNYFYAPENKIRMPVYYQRLALNGKTLRANIEKANAKVPGWDLDDLMRHYSALPIWYEPSNYGVTPEFPFKVVNWKTHFLVNGTYGNAENPWLQEIADNFVPDLKVVLMNRTTAGKAGYTEGQKVKIESQWGFTTEGKVHLTELIHPEVLGIAGNFGRLGMQMNPVAKEGAQFNQLVSADEGTIEPLAGNLDNSPRVRLTKI